MATAQGELEIYTSAGQVTLPPPSHIFYPLTSTVKVADDTAVVGLRAINTVEGKLLAEIGTSVVTDDTWRYTFI